MADKHIPNAEVRRVWLDTRLTTGQAAEAVGLSRSNLWRRAKALGLPARKPGQPYAIHDLDTLRQLWNGNVAVAEIAKALNVGMDAVLCSKRRIGLKPRRQGMKVLTLAEFELREVMTRDAAEWKRRQDEQAARWAAE